MFAGLLVLEKVAVCQWEDQLRSMRGAFTARDKDEPVEQVDEVEDNDVGL